MTTFQPLPNLAGLGLKPAHYEQALACDPSELFFEIHPENYMVDGGPRLAWLSAFCEKFSMSFHGVGLSLGGPDRPDHEHLTRLKKLVDRFAPAQISEHLAWSGFAGRYFADLLPPPASASSLQRLTEHIEETQEFLGRQLLIENPSLYLPIPDFQDLPELYVQAAKQSGAGLLFDLNNIVVCAANVDLPAAKWLDMVPGDLVGEIHVAGASARTLGDEDVLIDSHDAPVADAVWDILTDFIAANGAKPVLIERDDNLPDFDVLQGECARATDILQTQKQKA